MGKNNHVREIVEEDVKLKFTGRVARKGRREIARFLGRLSNLQNDDNVEDIDIDIDIRHRHSANTPKNRGIISNTVSMAPKRRTSTPRTAVRQQSTLSFAGKSRITKPSSPRSNKAAQKDAALLDDVVKTELEPTTAENAIAEQVEEEAQTLEDPLQSKTTSAEDVLGGRAEQSDAGAVGGTGSGWIGDEQATARMTSEAQINKYWRQKEQQRKAPRVHQEDLSVHEKVLREWDMSGQYGVCCA